MRVLLISPPRLHAAQSIVPLGIDRLTFKHPPLGLLYLAAYLKAHGYDDVHVMDCDAEGDTYEDIAKALRSGQPDVAGITVLSQNLYDAWQVARLTKEINNKIIVVFGGPHVSLYPQESIDLPYVDFCIRGEGERPFLEVLAAVERGNDVAGIPGVLSRESGPMRDTGDALVVEDVDMLPEPDRALLNPELYYSLLFNYEKMTTILTARGTCPFRCSFCSSGSSARGRRLRVRSAASIVHEVEACLAAGIRNIYFCDDLFTVDRSRVIQVCEFIIQKRLDVNWEVQARVDQLDESMVITLKRARCRRIRFGIESGSPRLLGVYRKGTTLGQAETAVGLAHEHGIETFCYFMIGGPGESEEEMRQTLELAKRLNPDYVRFSVATPYPGSELYVSSIAGGEFEDYWRNHAIHPQPEMEPIGFATGVSRQRVKEFARIAYREFHLRPRYALGRLLAIRSRAQAEAYVRGLARLLSV